MSDPGHRDDPGGPGSGGRGGAGSPAEGERPAQPPPGWPSWTPSNPPRGWPAWSPPTWTPEELESGRAAGPAPVSAQPRAAPPPAAALEAPARPGAGAEEPEPGADDVALDESFLTIWTQPRSTIRRIVARNASYRVLPLAALGGVAEVLSSQSGGRAGEASLGMTLLGALIAGPIWGMLTLYLGAWLIRQTGRWWLHGEAAAREVRTAVGWASLPHVLSLPLWLLATAAFGAQLYTATPRELIAGSWLYVLFILAVATLQLWGVVIASAGVAEVQGYRSAWKGFGNLVLAALVALLALIVLALVVGLLGALLGGLLR